MVFQSAEVISSDRPGYEVLTVLKPVISVGPVSSDRPGYEVLTVLKPVISVGPVSRGYQQL